VTTASLIDQAEQVFQAAMAAKQYSPAVSALREKAILAGLRVERKESGDAGAFAHLTEAELDQMILEEYGRLKAIPKPANTADDAFAIDIAGESGRKAPLSTSEATKAGQN
jgi:hypothetical protein